GLRALEADGFNVTVPHKTAVAGFADRLHLGATRIGAVNCVARDGEALVGHNTDAPGLVRALRSRRIDPSGRAVVVGAGGSARAAAFALAEHAQGLTILNRTLDRARSPAPTGSTSWCTRPLRPSRSGFRGRGSTSWRRRSGRRRSHDPSALPHRR